MPASDRLLIPAATRAWRLTAPGGGVDTGEEADSAAALLTPTTKATVGLPATLCHTIPLSLPPTEGDDLDAMVRAQLEKRGLLKTSDTSRPYSIHRLSRDAGKATVSVDILSANLPEECCFIGATHYLPYTRLYPLPANKLVILPQFGRLVLAAGINGKLLHSHILSPSLELPPQAALEVQTTRLALESKELLGHVTGIELWGNFPQEQATHLAAATGLPTNILPAPTLDLSRASNGNAPLLPASVVVAKKRKARRGQLTRLAILGTALYLVAAVLAWLYANSLTKKADRIAAEVAATAPGAQQVKDTAASWKAMRPVVDPRHFPMVILSEITRIMPPGGVVITEFEVKNTENLEIDGLAKDAVTASQLLEDVKKVPQLAAYTWTMSPPRMTDNNTAKFELQATIVK